MSSFASTHFSICTKVALTDVQIKLELPTHVEAVAHFVVKVVTIFWILIASTPCLGFGKCSFGEMFASIMIP
jgi:hypothetical protein